MNLALKETSTDELDCLRFFHWKFPENIARPVAFDGRTNILTVEFAGATYDKLKQEGRLTYGHLEDAIRFLAKMQKYAGDASVRGELYVDDVVAKEVDYFSNRAERLFGLQFLSGDGLALFRGNYWPVEETLQGAERRFHKDFNLGNIAEGPVVFDFEQPRFLPPQIDLVNLLEFYSAYLNDSQIASLLKLYVAASNRTFGKKADSGSFLKLYDYAAFHRHLEIAGYRNEYLSHAPSERDEMARAHHVERAKHYLGKIIKREQGKRKEAFERLDEVLSKIDCGEVKKDGFKVRPKSGVNPYVVFASLAAVAAVCLIGKGIVESRNVPLANKLLFDGKNEAAIVARTEDADGAGPSPKYELYLANTSEASKFGDISAPCIRWNSARDSILFVDKRRFATYDFRTGEKRLIGLSYRQPSCPVYLDDDTLVWSEASEGEELRYFKIKDALEGRLSAPNPAISAQLRESRDLTKMGSNAAISPNGKWSAYICDTALCIEGLSPFKKEGIVKGLLWASDSSGLFVQRVTAERFGEKKLGVMNVFFLDLAQGMEKALTSNHFPRYELLLGTKGVEYYVW